MALQFIGQLSFAQYLQFLRIYFELKKFFHKYLFLFFADSKSERFLAVKVCLNILITYKIIYIQPIISTYTIFYSDISNTI